MPSSTTPKPVIWVGPSRKELKALPPEVRQAFGVALWRAQCLSHVPSAHSMQGLRFRGVLEVRGDFDRMTCRMMLATNFDEAVYVLCAFPKKATRGIRTPARRLALVAKRLGNARELHARAER